MSSSTPAPSDAVLRIARAASVCRYPSATNALTASCSGVSERVPTNEDPPSSIPSSRSLRSTIRRSAVLRPIPGTRVSMATSAALTHATRSSTVRPERIASATRGPTPLTLSRFRNTSRCRCSVKPYSRCASSRTTTCVCRQTSLPVSGKL